MSFLKKTKWSTHTEAIHIAVVDLVVKTVTPTKIATSKRLIRNKKAWIQSEEITKINPGLAVKE